MKLLFPKNWTCYFLRNIIINNRNPIVPILIINFTKQQPYTNLHNPQTDQTHPHQKLNFSLSFFFPRTRRIHHPHIHTQTLATAGSLHRASAAASASIRGQGESRVARQTLLAQGQGQGRALEFAAAALYKRPRRRRTYVLPILRFTLEREREREERRGEKPSLRRLRVSRWSSKLKGSASWRLKGFEARARVCGM